MAEGSRRVGGNQLEVIILDTKGCCFLCLRDLGPEVTPVPPTTTSVKTGTEEVDYRRHRQLVGGTSQNFNKSFRSFESVSRYLKTSITDYTLSGGAGVGGRQNDLSLTLTSILGLNETSQLMVSLCLRCDEIVKDFSSVYEEHQKIKEDLKSKMKIIHARFEACDVANSRRRREYWKRMTSQPESLIQSGIVEQYRKDIKQKCLQSINSILEPLPFMKNSFDFDNPKTNLLSHFKSEIEKERPFSNKNNNSTTSAQGYAATMNTQRHFNPGEAVGSVVDNEWKNRPASSSTLLSTTPAQVLKGNQNHRVPVPAPIYENLIPRSNSSAKEAQSSSWQMAGMGVVINRRKSFKKRKHYNESLLQMTNKRTSTATSLMETILLEPSSGEENQDEDDLTPSEIHSGANKTLNIIDHPGALVEPFMKKIKSLSPVNQPQREVSVATTSGTKIRTRIESESLTISSKHGEEEVVTLKHDAKSSENDHHHHREKTASSSHKAITSSPQPHKYELVEEMQDSLDILIGNNNVHDSSSNNTNNDSLGLPQNNQDGHDRSNLQSSSCFGFNEVIGPTPTPSRVTHDQTPLYGTQSGQSQGQTQVHGIVGKVAGKTSKTCQIHMCDICEKVLGSSYSLKVHRDCFHKLGSLVKCTECSYITYRTDKLRAHETRVHKMFDNGERKKRGRGRPKKVITDVKQYLDHEDEKTQEA